MAPFQQLVTTTSVAAALAIHGVSGGATSRMHFGYLSHSTVVADHLVGSTGTNSSASSQGVEVHVVRPDNQDVKDVTVVTPGGKIVASVLAPRHWWGFPNYARDLETGPPSWSELARRHGHLGRACISETARRQCGTEFVCRHNTCQQCTVSRDCGEKYKCVHPPPVEEVVGALPFPTGSGDRSRSRSLCLFRDPVNHWSWREVCCTVLIAITAMLSAAAGMGGGGVYVPLLLLLLDFSTKEAVPLSQAMIAGGATVNVVMFCRDMQFGRPKINFEVVMMLNPGLAAGVTVGIMLHVMSPQWLIVVVLLVTLVIAFEKSLSKGLKQWREESKRRDTERNDAAIVEEGNIAGGDVSAVAVQETLRKLGLMAVAANQQRSLGLILGCWVTFLLYTSLKAPPCSLTYWLQLIGILAACCGFTAAGATTIAAGQGKAQADGADAVVWGERGLWFYPLCAVVAGLLGGFLGIGGGIIMGPLLLEFGLPPEVIQGTTAMFVFLSASLATIQFTALGKGMPAYAFWFTSWVMLATVVGQIAVDYAMRRWKRPSVVVLSIAAIIAGSMVMMGAVGTIDIVNDIVRGSNAMSFNPMHLCHP